MKNWIVLAFGFTLLFGTFVGRTLSMSSKGAFMGLVVALVAFLVGAMCAFMYCWQLGKKRIEVVMSARNEASRELMRQAKQMARKSLSMDNKMMADLAESTASVVAARVVSECMPYTPSPEHREAALEKADGIVDEEAKILRGSLRESSELPSDSS